MIIASANLNNLFDAYNFAVQLDHEPTREEIATAALSVVAQPGAADAVERLGLGEFTPAHTLVKPKPPGERARLAQRLLDLKADVILVQEAEHRDALKAFNELPQQDGGLGGRYPWVACIDGNDRRRIDVGVLSRLPIGGVTSWQHVVHPDEPNEPIFRRDLLEVDLLSDDFATVKLTCFVTHLKSHFIPWRPRQTPEDRRREAERNDEIRTLEADMIRRILERRQLDRPHLVTGDFNDSPDAPTMAPMHASGLSDGLANAIENPAYNLSEEDPPASTRWTHRFREDGTTSYHLFDQIWLDDRAAAALRGAGIARRTRKGKDGTDHDPVWVDLDL